MVDSADIVESVRQHLAQVIKDCSYERITAVERFPKGEGHFVFQVTYTDSAGVPSPVVVRVGAAGDARNCSRAEGEARILGLLDGHGAPRLLHFTCASQWLDAPTMCISYVPGDTRSFATLDASDAETLGAVLARVHLTDVSAVGAILGEARSAADYLAGRLETAVTARLDAAQKGLPGSIATRIKQAYRDVEKLVDATLVSTTGMWEGAELVLLHGDPGEANVIWSPEPVLIDWEYARRGDPADEIAYTFMDNRLNRFQRDALLRGYRAVAGEAAFRPIESRIETWEPLNLLGSAMWWIERYLLIATADQAEPTGRSTSWPAEHYLHRALSRLDRLAPS